VSRETDPTRLDLLWKLLARNSVHLTARARRGSSELDDLGLEGLFGPTLALGEMKQRLTSALEGHIRRGGAVNRVSYAGDEVRGDPVTFHEFRITIAGTRVYVKAELHEEADIVIVRSVKRRN
jgi:hypothetical protein